MSKEICRVFSLNGARYALLAPIYPLFGQAQLVDVVEVHDGDRTMLNYIPESIEVDIPEEGPFVIVASASAGHPYGRQARPAQIAIALSVTSAAAIQLQQVDDAEGRGLSAS